ncbi:hypothetical protein V2J09_020607 [Rumex salicifolius]
MQRISDPLTNDYNFYLDRQDEDSSFESLYRSVSQPIDYYRVVGFHESEHLYDRYDAHTNNESDEYEFFSAQIFEQFKDGGEESSRQSDDSLYDIHSSGTDSVDFENNGLLWLPPDPEDEDEDEEHSVSYDVDEEECTGDWVWPESPNCISSEDREKYNEEQHSRAMKDVVTGHFKSLILQLLQVENLVPSEEENVGESWLEIVTSLSWQVAALLKPDTSKDGSMDPGGYVKVKCLASGRKSESVVVKGVVCKKNVAHRRMKSKIDNAKILIVGGALEYQRVSNHLSSVNTLLRQETDHLKMVVAKIETHHPNIVLVENSVSRYAQEYLLARDISLVLNIKRGLLDRIARCSGAQMIPSIQHLVSPKLGACGLFYVEKCFEEHGSAGQGGKKLTKNLMFFSDCPKPLGFTILLKGANGDELKKVKHVVQYGVFAAYHLALETSFLEDEGASLPTLPIKPTLPDKPSQINTKILSLQYNNTSEVQKSESNSGSSANSPISYETSPLSTRNQTSPTQLTKHASSINLSVVALLSSMQQFSDSQQNDHFQTYDFGHDTETEVSLTPSIKDGESPNFLYNSENPDEHDCSNYSCDDTLNKSASSEENDSCGHLIMEGTLPSASEQGSLLVSLTTRCVWKGILCDKAQFLRIKYYGSFDKPLGRNTVVSLVNNLRKHIYKGSLTISVTKLVELILPGEKERKIWMWHRCLRCPRINGFPPSTQRVAMSDAAWGFSFGKFLELSFSNQSVACRISNCGHSIHKDCLSCGRMVACFRYTPIDLYSVYLPPLKIEFSCEKKEWIEKEAIEVTNKANLFFNEVKTAIKQIFEEVQAGSRGSTIVMQELREHCQELESTLAREKEEFEESLERALNREENVGEPGIDVLELNRLRRQLLFQSYVWDQRLLHAVNFHKNSSKEVNSPKSVVKPLYFTDSGKKNVTSTGSNDHNSEVFYGKPGNTNNQGGDNTSPVKNKTAESLRETDFDLETNHATYGKILLMNLNKATSLDILDSGGSIQRSLSDGQSPLASLIGETENPPSMKEDDSVFLEKTLGKSASKRLDNDKYTTKRVDTEKVSSPRISFLAKTSSNVDKSTGWLGVPFLSFYRSLNTSSSWNQHKLDNVKGYNPVYITSFKEFQCQDGARLLLPVGINDTIVAVYDDEPSSIITYSLLSPFYHSQLSNDNDTRKGIGISYSLQHLDLEIPYDSPSEASVEPLRSYVSAAESMMSLTRLRSSLSLDPLFYAKPMHTRISFSDDGPLGMVKYTVVAYFARRFEALRKICCSSQFDFARSLSRCMKWGAQGGKSKVFFAKTPDDRFILKQVTKTELESFIKFAPAYFKYLSESISNEIPTCLAKILGVYQVTKQPKGGKETKMDILVMENLLHGRNITRVYDLKGSMRSRYAKLDSNEGNKVLLDQNMVEATENSPIFVGNITKRVLERAIWNDTSFLAAVDVMDYSLLVGVDEEKHELVVGIIDFMRQYTWDKHLETWVKASGLLGGPKNVPPTVISPVQYKKRFRKAMSSYFLMVPEDSSTDSSDPPTGSIFDICEDY